MPKASLFCRSPNKFQKGQSFYFQAENISLKQVGKRSQLVYISALPQQLANLRQEDSLVLASRWLEMVSAYTSLRLTLTDSRAIAEILQGLVVQTTPSGFLQFEFQDRAIAQWLNSLICDPTIRSSEVSSFKQVAIEKHLERRIFAIQYAHARCCSILRLAHREKLINLQFNHHPCEFLSDLSNFFYLKKDLWLTDDRHLRTHEPTERYLIGQLIAALDELMDQPSYVTKRLLNLTEGISQAFQEVQQAVQLFGSFATASRDRLHAHLALLLATQRILHHLLTTLEYPAPIEL